MSRGTINKVILIGRLGKDPDMRYAPSGTAIASFSLATNHNSKDAEGNWQTQTEWHNVKTFGRQAEFVGEYLKKGRLAFVEGRLQTSSWEDQNGQKKYKTEILAQDIQLLGSRSDNEAQESTAPATTNQAPAQTKPAQPAQPEQNEQVEEDDLPF